MARLRIFLLKMRYINSLFDLIWFDFIYTLVYGIVTVLVAAMENGRAATLQRFCCFARHSVAALSVPCHSEITTKESHRHWRSRHYWWPSLLSNGASYEIISARCVDRHNYLTGRCCDELWFFARWWDWLTALEYDVVTVLTQDSACTVITVSYCINICKAHSVSSQTES